MTNRRTVTETDATEPEPEADAPEAPATATSARQRKPVTLVNELDRARGAMTKAATLTKDAAKAKQYKMASLAIQRDLVELQEAELASA